jgi:hypothetical protein
MLPIGDKVLLTVRTSALGTAQATEWIATGLQWIDRVLGVTVIGDTVSTVEPSVQLNAQGTGVAEGTNAGDLGVETTDAGINVLEITVLGKYGAKKT